MALMIVGLIAINTVMIILVGIGAWNRMGQMQEHLEHLQWRMLDTHHENFVRELWNNRIRLRPVMRPNNPSDKETKPWTEGLKDFREE